MSDNEKTHKIEMLRQMMLNAEKTIESAKAMLLQLEGKKKTGRKRKVEDDSDGTVVEGTFDGQIMVGTDGKQYPVPANYASKSKLVEGDVLKLTITSDGSFIYKQIGPAQRKNVIGIVSQDEKGNYFVFSEGKPYKVLLASITYFKAEPGDEVVIVVPREEDAVWAAIENVISKGGHGHHNNEESLSVPFSKKIPADGKLNSWKDDFFDEEDEIEKPKKNVRKKKLGAKEEAAGNNVQPDESYSSSNKKPEETKKEDDLVDEWTSDIEDLEKEIAAQV